MSEAPMVPPPWKLTGSATSCCTVVARLRRGEYVCAAGAGGHVRRRRRRGAAGRFTPRRRSGRIGSCCSFGPLRARSKGLYSVTKAYVSTPAAMASGRANWGIPRELADFTVTHEKASTVLRWPQTGTRSWRPSSGPVACRFRPARGCFRCRSSSRSTIGSTSRVRAPAAGRGWPIWRGRALTRPTFPILPTLGPSERSFCAAST